MYASNIQYSFLKITSIFKILQLYNEIQRGNSAKQASRLTDYFSPLNTLIPLFYYFLYEGYTQLLKNYAKKVFPFPTLICKIKEEN